MLTVESNVSPCLPERMRSEVLAAASVGLTALVLANAWVQRQQFYPSVVYITKSNPSMAVIYLQVEFLTTYPLFPSY